MQMKKDMDIGAMMCYNTGNTMGIYANEANVRSTEV